MENFGDYHDLYLKTDVLLLVNVFINYTIMCLIIPQFKHIHGTGWSYIIDDLNYTQAKAFGLVLNEMDATKNWENHLINIFKSCYVHFKRKIYEKRYDDILANDMLALLTATSEVEINNLFNKIETKKPEWATFYQQKWVIASLNKCISKIDNETWITTPDITIVQNLYT
ncbi:hypothetical protein RhiirB3_475209 [Rhizophagus irregularis]|nr:hypothetical protein RhiirB3_475209 [Rhizophagus irregularis]